MTAGFPAATQYGGTSLVTTAPAPITAPLPTRTPPIIIARRLIQTSSSITIGDLCKKVLPPTAETKTKIFSCFHPKSLLIRLKSPLNPPWIPD